MISVEIECGHKASFSLFDIKSARRADFIHEVDLTRQRRISYIAKEVTRHE